MAYRTTCLAPTPQVRVILEKVGARQEAPRQRLANTRKAGENLEEDARRAGLAAIGESMSKEAPTREGVRRDAGVISTARFAAALCPSPRSGGRGRVLGTRAARMCFWPYAEEFTASARSHTAQAVGRAGCSSGALTT
jgi:hypothetical protein